MTSETKNTALSPAVASETSQGTSTEAGFNFLLSQCAQFAKHQRPF